MKTKMLIVGPRGKMGRLITAIAAERETIDIVGGVGPAGRAYIGQDIGEVALVGSRLGAPVVDDIEAIIDRCDIVVDLSTVEQAMVSLAAARHHRKAIVCGTTGFSQEQRQAFADAGEDIPVMLAANTSRLVNILYKLLGDAVRLAGAVDAEILDMHDAGKLDAPSGTARELAVVIAEARGEELPADVRYGREGRCPRVPGEIAFHSIRGGDLSSSHTVYLIGQGERLELTHHASSFRCFAAGIVDCAEFLVQQPAGSYSVQDCFGL